MTESASLMDEVMARGDLPRHVAIIMDGNGRWARKRMLPRVMGHREGRKAVRRVLEAGADLGLDFLTLYTFSTENWKRPRAEVKALMSFLVEVLEEEFDNLHEKGIRLEAMGRLEQLPEETAAALRRGMERLSGNEGMQLTLALSYGGRAELADAARSLAREAAAGRLDPETVDEDAQRRLVEQYLAELDGMA